MGKKKINNNFTKAYSQMESQCQEKFGVSAGGVNKYIERLESARFAPDREDVLGKLSMYQNLSQRFENDPSAAKRVKELSKSDVQWVKKFGDSVKKKNDPISRYLKSARKYVRGRKIRRTILAILIILIVLAGATVALSMLDIIPLDLPFLK